jgi:hypothetical protein
VPIDPPDLRSLRVFLRLSLCEPQRVGIGGGGGDGERLGFTARVEDLVHLACRELVGAKVRAVSEGVLRPRLSMCPDESHV